MKILMFLIQIKKLKPCLFYEPASDTTKNKETKRRNF